MKLVLLFTLIMLCVLGPIVVVSDLKDAKITDNKVKRRLIIAEICNILLCAFYAIVYFLHIPIDVRTAFLVIFLIICCLGVVKIICDYRNTANTDKSVKRKLLSHEIFFLLLFVLFCLYVLQW